MSISEEAKTGLVDEDIFSLSGRIAIVTGGGKNIGRSIAEGLLARGAKVYINGRKEDLLVATAQELGGDCIPLPGDISSKSGCDQLIAEFHRQEDHLDILVNNAGTASLQPFGSVTEEAWDKAMNTDVKGPFFLTQAAHTLLKRSGRPDRPAKIIMISSVDAVAINRWETYAYHASKAGLLHLTRKLAAHLAAEHIVVSGIAPGAFASDMNIIARDHPEILIPEIPMGRIGSAADIGGCAVFLASNAGNYVVGDTLLVDGGVALAKMH